MGWKQMSDTIYYMKWKDNADDLNIADLYSLKMGTATLLAEDIMYDSIYFYDDGTTSAYTKYIADLGYELAVFHLRERKRFSEIVLQAMFADKTLIFFIFPETSSTSMMEKKKFCLRQERIISGILIRWNILLICLDMTMTITCGIDTCNKIRKMAYGQNLLNILQTVTLRKLRQQFERKEYVKDRCGRSASVFLTQSVFS